MKDLASFLASLFKDLKLPLRWVAVILSVLLVVMLLLGYERVTGHFYFSSLEKKVAILKDLQAIANEGVSSQYELYPIYRSAVKELAQYEIHGLTFAVFPSASLGNENTLGKAISGTFVWLLILVIGVSSDVKKERRVTSRTIVTAVFLIIVAAVSAWIGAIIPTLWNPWVNYVGFPLLQIVLLYWAFGKSKKTQEKGEKTPKGD